jgi:L-lactate dehydrogenase
VVGEHGDSEVLTWSTVHIAGIHLDHFCDLQGIRLNEEIQRQIDSQVRNAAYSIIKGKGATYYGIGSAVAKIVDVVLHDQRSVLTVSTRTPTVAGVSDVSVSLPRLVGGQGVMATFPLHLSRPEQDALEKSCRVLREALEELTEQN